MRRIGPLGAGKVLAALLLASVLVACAGDEPPYVERSVEELYNAAMDDLQRDRFAGAAVAFEEVERQHPYSVWATRAQLMAAYAFYQDNKYDQAVLAANRFIQLHPGHRDVDYAYYLVAISYYERISDVRRDQEMTDDARRALLDVVRRFPDTDYARDARLKLDLTNDHLAGREMGVGRFYLKRKQYLAAIKRFQTVIEEYQTTSHVPEALHRLTEAYLALGVTDEAQATAAVLGHNYPGSVWYQDSYALLTGQNLAPESKGGSWIGRAWKAIF